MQNNQIYTVETNIRRSYRKKKQTRAQQHTMVASGGGTLRRHKHAAKERKEKASARCFLGFQDLCSQYCSIGSQCSIPEFQSRSLLFSHSFACTGARASPKVASFTYLKRCCRGRCGSRAGAVTIRVSRPMFPTLFNEFPMLDP